MTLPPLVTTKRTSVARLGALAAVAVLAATLTGCHGSSSGASDHYCSDVRASKTSLSALNGSVPNKTEFSAALAAVQQIDAEAPDSVKGPWDVLDHTLSNFQATLDRLGITVDDIPLIESGKEGINDPSEYQTLSSALKGLQSPALSAATATINVETIKDCNVSLQATG